MYMSVGNWDILLSKYLRRKKMDEMVNGEVPWGSWKGFTQCTLLIYSLLSIYLYINSFLNSNIPNRGKDQKDYWLALSAWINFYKKVVKSPNG